ncbi:hypothetical protein BD779DRAFT_1530641 [Infundibulicybe gibba]|nr:hypothetical protein BD779DRAFT_1530641 [Infundibulicybe gibba]
MCISQLKTRKPFRAVCQRINFCIAPELLSCIVIDIQEKRIDVSISQLEALATRLTCAGEYVRVVDIRCLSPSYNPQILGLHRESSKASWARRKMCELLPAALSTLSGAKAVIWKINKGDLEEARALVAEFSRTISSPTVVASSDVSTFQLNHTSRLTRLTIACLPSQAGIAEIVGASPNLVSLDLHCSRYDDKRLIPRDNKPIPTLHEILSIVPHERPLRLKRLGISDYFVRFDDKVLPHLRLLESLELSIVPPIVNDYHRSHFPEAEVVKSDRFSSSTSDLWKVVEREGIGLKSVAGPVDNALLDYLSAAEYDDDARDFFVHILPRHAKTLVSLSIAACTQLTELTITLYTCFSMGDLVTEAIDMAAALPNLRQLGLLWITRERITGFSSIFDVAIHPQTILVGYIPSSRFCINRCPDGTMKYIRQVQ